MRVSGEVTVRTDEPDGVRVWLRPNESPGEDLDYSYAGSSLIDGSELTLERDFRVFAGDDDVTVDGVRVTAQSSSRQIVLDEVVAGALTYRSLATTTVTVTPSTGSLEQGQPVAVALAFELDTPRDVTVTVEPAAPDGYDYDVGPWSDRRQVATDTFTGVTTGDLAASLTVLDLMEGSATIDRLRVTITDPTVGLIYTKDVDVGLVFDEPSP